MMPREGLRIKHYLLLQRIRTGGMGEVYLAADEQLNRRVAIKVIEIDYFSYNSSEEAEEAARLFIREAQAIAKFDHRYILPIYDAGQVSIDDITIMYMVMPFRAEGSLADWLRKRTPSRILPLQDVGRIVMQAAEALIHAHHRGIIHQDVKPANFLIQGTAERSSQLTLQLADFGIAKLLTTANQSQAIRGTPLYMAPEQWEGATVAASDQYALAVMAYELIAGRPPFLGSNLQVRYQHKHTQPRLPGELNPDIPEELDQVLMRALSKDTRQRYRSVVAFARAFQAACHNDHAIPTTQRKQPAASANSALFLPTVYVSPAGNSISLTPSQPQMLVKKTFIALLLVLLIIAGSLGFLFYTQWHSSNSNTLHQRSGGNSGQAIAKHSPTTSVGQATTPRSTITTTPSSTSLTATAAASATVAAQASAAAASATAAVNASATASAQATMTAYDNQIVIGPLAINDALKDNSQGYQWSITTIPGNLGGCSFVNQSYHSIIRADGTSPCFSVTRNFTNFSYGADVLLLAGDQAGIIFRGQSNQGNFECFTITSTGNYAIQVFQNYNLSSTIAQGQSSAINTKAGQMNLLAVKVVNNAISIYINKQPITTIADTSFSQSDIGMIAEDTGAATDAVFSNVLVWTQS
ncbi:MAG TPA: serine/threonine-protein kinase [Ktedonobacteraceae bacterium]|nr:serine/threonine-protein kinase [Ktedonobacteraceae bacterium]